MSKKILYSVLSVSIVFILLSSYEIPFAQAASRIGENTLVLYDGSSGDIADPSLMGYTAFPPDGASLRYEDGASVLDTAIAGTDTYAGWVASAATIGGFPILNSTDGFQVNFKFQVEHESHDSSNRSGLSLIILDSHAKGVEMSFWTNEVWVQNDDSTGALFTHGEGVAFDMTAALIDYQITIIGDTYTLAADSRPLLTGPVRDYSAFDRFPDPYETPNFLFLGDDTTSAQGRVRLQFLSVTGSEPVTPTSAVTSTSTGIAEPTATVLPDTPPVPSPTPAGRLPNLCPSGWLLVAVIGNILLIRRHKRTSRQL